MHTLVLLRHGQSAWNLENRFTGWTDVGLTEQGKGEAIAAATLLREGGYDFDVCLTSVLSRAIMTLYIVLNGLDRLWLPVTKSWRLNERHYGALQGLNKAQTAAKFGEEQVFTWRRSFDTRPPALTRDDPRFPGQDRRYAALTPDELPTTECLKDTVDRVMPFWHTVMAPAISAGTRLLVAAHGNSLRALVKYLDDIDDKSISQLNIPTGVPLIYELDDDLKPQRHFYLGDPDAIAKSVAAVAAQGKAK